VSEADESDPIWQAINLTAGYRPAPPVAPSEPARPPTLEEVLAENARLRAALKRTVEAARETRRRSEEIMAELAARWKLEPCSVSGRRLSYRISVP
jgi:hypothetical protein